MAFLDFVDPGNSGGSVPTPPSPWDRLPPPAPMVYQCSVCNATFRDADQLSEHRFSAHPYRRPALILRGRELTSPREIVVEPLLCSHIALANTDCCIFDGRPVKPELLPRLLAKCQEGLHTIMLEKRGIETTYELDFEIADAVELAKVERLFLSIVGSETLSLDRINLFAEMTSKYATARRYMDGLCHYLYGVLAKDQRGGTHLPQTEYKTKFNLALDGLRLFGRPLSDLVVGIVNFSQNAFNDGNRLAASPRLQDAMRMFWGFLNDIPHRAPVRWLGEGVGNVPVDHATDQIVNWAVETTDEVLRQRRQMEAVTSASEWVPDDRFKVAMLLAERLASDGQVVAAQRFARSVTNDAVFGEWAQRIMELDAET